MAEIDPQMLFGFGFETYLRKLKYEPRSVDVLEIYRFEVTKPKIISTNLDESGMKTWLNSFTEMPADEQGKKAVGGLRLILGPASETEIPPEILPTAFPHYMKDVYKQKSLPFSKELFKMIIEKFHLPASTPQVFLTRSSHFQRHNFEFGVLPARIGFTMRRSTRGIIAMNIALSISYNLNSGLSSVLLLGCSDTQQSFVREQIKTSYALADHPLILPILLTTYQRQLLNRETKRLWISLIDIETQSGQTGAPAIGSRIPQDELRDYNSITNGVLGTIQLTATWESYTKALILGIESIQESITYISAKAPESRKAKIEAAAAVLLEWLAFVSHKSNVMLWDLQFIDKRAQAQMTAVYNYIAQKDARLNQKLSEYSTELAADSRQIAAAAKRDSTAMKGIAVLTMVFLPGTYIATFFAMPLFDFSDSSRAPSVKPSFWIYWVLTIPLTAIVLTIYLSYLVRSQRKHREEDKMAREATVQKRDIQSPIIEGEKHFDEGQTTTSFLVKLVSEGFHRKSARHPSLNPELGLPSSEDRVSDLRKRKIGKQPVSRTDIGDLVSKTEAKPVVGHPTTAARVRRRSAGSGVSMKTNLSANPISHTSDGLSINRGATTEATPFVPYHYNPGKRRGGTSTFNAPEQESAPSSTRPQRESQSSGFDFDLDIEQESSFDSDSSSSF